MGSGISVAELQDCAFLNELRAGTSRNLLWTAGLQSLPRLHPAAVTDSSVLREFTAVCSDIAQTAHLGEVLRHVSAAVDGAASNRQTGSQLCSLLVLLRGLLHAAHRRSASTGEPLHEVCKVPGGDGRRAHGGAVAVDTLVSFVVGQDLEDEVNSLSSFCEALAALQVCVSAPLYEQSAASGQAPPGTDADPGAPLIDHVVSHDDSGRLCAALLGLVQKAHVGEVGQGIAPHGAGTAVGAAVDFAATKILPAVLVKQLAPSGRRQRLQLSGHVGRRAALLLVALVFHRKNGAAVSPTPFLCSFREVAPAGGNGALLGSLSAPGALLHHELVLLLCSLLSENAGFLDEVLRSPAEGLLVPLLQCLHNETDAGHGPAALYVVLTVLLMLSQYPGFMASAHSSRIKRVPWFTDQEVRDVSAGSLMVIELVRLVQRNHTHDVYVTRQAVSILSNNGPGMRGIHHHAAQRLVSLLVSTGKKALREGGSWVDLHRDVGVCAHDALVCSMQSNAALVYELLHRREGLSAELPPVDSLLQIVDFFGRRIEVDGAASSRSTVDEVMASLRDAAAGWEDSSRQQIGADRYVFAEEASPETFFTPHCWDLAVRYYAASEADAQWLPSQLPMFGGRTPPLPPAPAPEAVAELTSVSVL
eukprot:TRINITY_DN4824_c9_g1_i1.p1 TRINITY_DN4824_c9_g1~~TRINITY_DN4824_c9_g1_i1.p1  ORF type:complete len:646 (+),score=175.66 TRINITY_DN4824_c9_g1_i1:150-2087(+)